MPWPSFAPTIFLPPLPALRMHCGFPNASFALTHQWLARVGGSFTMLGNHLRLALHTISSVASALLSFESLVIVSLISFLFIGGALSVFFLWSIIAEGDDYDDCERGRALYYAGEGVNGRWAVGMAVPVILVDTNRPMKRPLGVIHDAPRIGKRQ
ncbi:hypothetical protein C8F04DRAFT_1112805 [Mycena alexandri]|uniref:Uncharacterized protein n=1 Tax=Mycena alexandri TaxID=1745969 RepID=A0AAD6X3D2_9AGAR|nr:hypothetical protein C8F04DRAFT_1112805 [Mycena alexandri]